MNNEPVSREEFEALKKTVSDVLVEFRRVLGVCETATTNQMMTGHVLNGHGDRLKAAERLADGVKDAVLGVARAVDSCERDTGRTRFNETCRIIAAAQHPAPSAEGAPIAIKEIGNATTIPAT